MTDKPGGQHTTKPPPFETSILTAAKGGGILTVGRLFAYGSSFVIAFFLARLLGAEEQLTFHDHDGGHVLLAEPAVQWLCEKLGG